jgi:hypothetical protein
VSLCVFRAPLHLGKTAFAILKLAYLPSPGKVRLRISGNKQGITGMAIEEYVVSLNLIINDIVGYEEERRSSFWWGYVKKER